MRLPFQLWLGCFVCAGHLVAEPHEVSFRLDKPGPVSAAVYDTQGRMLRELARGVKMDAGEQRLTWDGLDRYGQPAPAGEYEWRLLQTPGFTREFLVNIGTNPGWTPFDLWPGNHGGPTTLLVDGTNLYVGATASEGPPHLIKISADGRKKFWSTGTHGLRDGLIGLARIDKVLYLLFQNGTLQILNTETGAPFSADPKLKKFARQPFAALIHSGEPDAETKREDRTQVSPMTLAGGKDFLVVTYQKYDEVRFLWPKDDVFGMTKSVHVPEPKGCCIAPDGRVFVVSGKSIVRVDPETGEATPVIAGPDLASPTRVAYDAVNDDLLVIQHGEHLDDVRRYHAADGRLIAVYGRPAGRTYGAFNPLDWGGLLDIASDGQGGFFTAEEFPRRVAHFQGRERHELVAQWFGGTQWGALCALDPADPTVVYLYPDSSHCARGKIDYDTRTWTLTEYYDLPEGFSQGRRHDMFPKFGGASYWEVRHVGGVTFLVNNGQQQGGCAAVVRVDDREHRLLPVAFLGGLHPALDRSNPPAWWLAAMKREGFDPKTTGYEHFAFSWSDTNRNGKIDAEETGLGSIGNVYRDGACFIDSHWNVYYPLRPRVQSPAKRPGGSSAEQRPFAWLVVTNEGSDELPVWNWNHAQHGNGIYPAIEMRLGASSPRGIFQDASGAVYTVCNSDLNWYERDIPPLNWPNNTTGTSRFQKWSASGGLEWSVGLHTAAGDRPAGEFAQVRGILGEVHDCLVVLDAREPASVWTRDGLFAGSLYGQRANDGLPDIAYDEIYQDDNLWGMVMQTSNGDVLWGGISHNSTPVYRISGWDGWERLSGKLVIKQPTTPARWQGAGLHAEYFANTNLAGQPAVRKQDTNIGFGPMWGNHRLIAAGGAWPDKGEMTALSTNGFSARWTGFLEAPLGGNFTFAVYTYGQSHGTNISGSRVRLWVDERLVIDQWDNVADKPVPQGYGKTRECSSLPVVLTAGRLAPIRLEYATAVGDEGQLHLFMGSESWDLRHVPQALLYPDRNDKPPGR